MAYNLTDDQKDLLRLLVEVVRNEGKGKTFLDASFQGQYALIKPGGGSLYISDIQDMKRLVSEGLLDHDISSKSYTITQAAFDAVDNNFEVPEESKSSGDTYIGVQHIGDTLGGNIQGVGKATQAQIQQKNSKSDDSFWTKVSAKADVVLAIVAVFTVIFVILTFLRDADDQIPPDSLESTESSQNISSTLTPILTRNLTHHGECKPQPLPTNMPCIFIMPPDKATPYLIAEALFRTDIELVKRYAGVIYELLRNENGYYGGTSAGNVGISKGRILVPSIDEAHDLEYFQEYLGYGECVVDGDFPCLYEVSEKTEIDKINDYESIAIYFSNLSQCIQQANRTIYTKSKNYPDQVLDIEYGVVLIIPVAQNDCV